jgi:hypothetical protein
MMSRVQKGVVAGFAATVVVSVLEAINMLAGPWFTPFPHILASMLGMGDNLAVGWIAHVVIGTVVLGGLFGILCPRLPTDLPATKGIAFAVAAFAALIVGILMFGDPSVFSGSDGFMTVAWLLFSNAVFGFVMGSVYGTLVEREKKAAKLMAGLPAH